MGDHLRVAAGGHPVSTQVIPPPIPGTANHFVHRSSVWIRVGKAGALFVLPIPLSFAVLSALVGGDVARLALTVGGLGCFWSAGVLTWRALVDEAQWILGDRAELPNVPFKLISLVLTGVGSSLAALAGGHSVISAVPFAGVSALGYLAFFGRDPKAPRVELPVVTGVDPIAVAQQLELAYQRLRRIDAAGRAMTLPEFRDRLTRISDISRTILDEIRRDPRAAGRARRFLHLYLESVERVTEEYARTHRQVHNAALEQNFRRLLVETENTFAEQRRKLLETDVTALDVEIEVLNARLKRDATENHLETRS
jgi:5-bromo-4-chloroindolyl phosphate hydrolysis protein